MEISYKIFDTYFFASTVSRKSAFAQSHFVMSVVVPWYISGFIQIVDGQTGREKTRLFTPFLQGKHSQI